MIWLDSIPKGARTNKEPAILFQASEIEFRMMSLGMVGEDKRHCVWSFRHDSQPGLKAFHRQGDTVSKPGGSFRLFSPA